MTNCIKGVEISKVSPKTEVPINAKKSQSLYYTSVRTAFGQPREHLKPN